LRPQQQQQQEDTAFGQTTDRIIATLFYDLLFPQATTTDLSNNLFEPNNLVEGRRGRWLR
jgi:hypothetical protein